MVDIPRNRRRKTAITKPKKYVLNFQSIDTFYSIVFSLLYLYLYTIHSIHVPVKFIRKYREPTKQNGNEKTDNIFTQLKFFLDFIFEKQLHMCWCGIGFNCFDVFFLLRFASLFLFKTHTYKIVSIILCRLARRQSCCFAFILKQINKLYLECCCI